jgi:tRNA G18 (ribose-2'-O)-methylase SpoU
MLRTLSAAGIEVWGLTPQEGAEPIREAARRVNGRRVAVVLGSEGPGLTDATLASCDRQVRIPMRKATPGVDSLNVAMTLGIALHCLGDI